MKSLLLVIVFFVTTNVYSQEKFLSISNTETGKVSVFKQNKRIRVKTIQGGKISGKLTMVEDDQIMVGKIIIPIASIAKIKNNPLLLNIINSGLLIVSGGFLVLVSVVAIAWGGTGLGILIGVGGIGAVFAGF